MTMLRVVNYMYQYIDIQKKAITDAQPEFINCCQEAVINVV